MKTQTTQSETEPRAARVLVETLLVAVLVTLAAGIAHRASSHHRDDGDDSPAQSVVQTAP